MSGPAWLSMVLLLLAPAGWAVLLRWARCPGWSVVGGAVAGLVLGPTVFGRVMPDEFERIFTGGVQQRAALQALAGRHGADRLVAETAGFDARQMAELAEAQGRQREAALAELTAAQWSHQQPLRIFVGAVVAAVLLGAAAFSVPRSEHRQPIVSALSVGAWSAALPGGLAFFAMRQLWAVDAAEAALAAAAIAIGPWALTPADRAAADFAEHGGARMIQTAGRVATVIALAVAAAALYADHGAFGLLWLAPLTAGAAGWLIRAGARRGRAAFRGTLAHVIVPTLAASVAVTVDLVDDWSLWLVLVVLLLSGDGRWLGAFVGARVLGGRRGLRTMRLVLGSVAAGPTQLAVAAVALFAGSIEPGTALALLLGAVLIEVTAPTRRGMSRRIVGIEE